MVRNDIPELVDVIRHGIHSIQTEEPVLLGFDLVCLRLADGGRVRICRNRGGAGDAHPYLGGIRGVAGQQRPLRRQENHAAVPEDDFLLLISQVECRRSGTVPVRGKFCVPPKDP